MIELTIPEGDKTRQVILHHLVLDFNGTLAVDGTLLPEAASRLRRLAENLEIHILTADTFGHVRDEMADLPVTVTVIPGDGAQDHAKRTYVRSLGTENTCAVGNGRNDALMVAEAALGFALVQAEGAWSGTLSAADVVATEIGSALDLLLNPKRLTATLRR